jgi:hypothetical protein
MHDPNKKRLPCPICKKAPPEEHPPHYPFCSERCQQIDLSAWLDGKYAIPAEDSPPSEDSESPEKP